MKPHVCLIALCCISCLGWVGCGPTPPATSLPQAIEKGDLKTVQQHIAAKSDLNRKDSAGWAPLHLAAMQGNLEIFKALIKAGADPNQKGKNGKTPLDVALEKGQTAIVQFLQGGTGKTGGRGLIDGGLGIQQGLDNM